MSTKAFTSVSTVLSVFAFCSSNPVPKKKEYVVPLIRKVIWRGVGEGGGGEEKEGEGEGISQNDQVKMEERLALDKEAAKAIISGIHDRI